MRILIDGDAFPNMREIIEIAREKCVEIKIYMDFNHEFESDYGEVIFVSPGPNQVDLVIQNEVRQNDIVLTQDYGVAVIALAKRAQAVNQLGKLYTNQNIDYLLEQKVISAKARRHTNIKGPKKRTKEDKARLLEVIVNLLGE